MCGKNFLIVTYVTTNTPTPPNPIQYLIGSLGGCVKVKILLALSDKGIVPDYMTIAIHATRVKTMPAFFDTVHLRITLRANADDAMVSGIIGQTLARLCPIHREQGCWPCCYGYLEPISKKEIDPFRIMTDFFSPHNG